MKVFDTTIAFIGSHVKSTGYNVGDIISVEGYSIKGDFGNSQWKATGNVIAPSQDPLALNDIKMSDASGNEFELVTQGGIIDLNVLGGTTAAYVNIANAAGLTYSQGLTSDVSDDIKNIDTIANLEATAVTVSDIGKRWMVAERANGIFEAKTGLTANGFDIIQSSEDAGIQFQLDSTTKLSSTEFGAEGLADATACITRLVAVAKTLTTPFISIDCDLTASSTLLFDVPDETTIEWIGAVSSSVVDAAGITIGGEGLNVSRVNMIGGIKIQRTTEDTTGSSIGVRLLSLVWCYIDVRESTGFYEGVRADGIDGNGGFSYCEVHLGRIQDNVINLRLTASTGFGGYCNDNNFYGGSFRHRTGYPAVATTNLQIDHFAENVLNNNRFYGPSFEDQTTIQKAATINGTANTIFHPRFERPTDQGTYEIEFTSNSIECGIISKGFFVADTNITDNGANNFYTTRQGELKSNQTAAIANGNNPVSSDEVGMRLKGTAANDSCQLGIENTAGSLTAGILGTGLVWSGNRIYAESGFRWQTSSGGIDDRGLFVGTGSPEGVVTARAGSLYTDSGGGAGTTLYVKESGTGNTGWIAK